MVASLNMAIPETASLPLSYSIDSYEAVGEIAKASSLFSYIGKSSELLHLGTMSAEIALEGCAAASVASAGVAVAGPLLAAVGGVAAMYDAWSAGPEYHARAYAKSGYALGAVMGADGRARSIRSYFAYAYIPALGAKDSHDAAKKAYLTGLLVGGVQGTKLSAKQRALFWRDLGRRMGDQSNRGDPSSWSEQKWKDWYFDASLAMRKSHIN